MEISVIIPTYKPQIYLLECLLSLNLQSFSKQDFEIIVVLNGDKFPYWNALAKYKQQFSTLQINIFYSEQKGVSYARNLALNNTQGKYITFIDDDDIVSPDYLSRLVAKVDRDCLIVASNLKTFVNDVSSLGDDYVSRAFLLTRKRNVFTRRSFLSCAGGKLIPYDVIGERRFNSNFCNGEDCLFMFLISDRIKFIELTDEDAVYYRRIRENSASQKNKGRRYYFINANRAIAEYFRYYFSNPFNYNIPLLLSRVVAAFFSIFK